MTELEYDRLDKADAHICDAIALLLGLEGIVEAVPALVETLRSVHLPLRERITKEFYS